MWVDGIKCSMKGVDSIPFDDTKAVIHIALALHSVTLGCTSEVLMATFSIASMH